MFVGLLAIGCDSSSPPPPQQDWAQTGWNHFRLGEDGFAADAFDRAVQKNPDDAFVLAMRGVARAAHGYFGFREKSIQGDSGQARLTPSWNWGRPVLSETEKLRQALNTALSDVEKAALKEPADARISLCRGLVYLLRSDVEGPSNLQKAIEVLSQTIVLDARLPDAWIYRAWAHFKSIPQSQWVRIKPFIEGSVKPTNADRKDAVVVAAADTLRRATEDVDKCPKGTFLLHPRIDAGPWMSTFHPRSWLDDPFALPGRPPLSDEEFFRIAKDAVVFIRTDSGTGSGFFPAQAKVLLTNFHVIEKDKDGQVEVMYRNGKAVTGTVIHRDKKRDLAAIRVNDLPPGNLSSLHRPDHMNAAFMGISGWWANDATVGEEVFVIGNPKGVTWTVTKGIVSAKRQIDGVLHIQYDAATHPGSSGGPALTKQGAILGVHMGGVEGQGLNFAIAPSEARPFFEAAILR
jgi:S1-C subfamily serine protease